MKKLLKAVLSAILCIFALTSCVNESGENIADSSETATEEVTEMTTEELTTPETTTEEITETTTEELTTSETTPKETEEVTTISIPDEATILASLTDEEKEVWLSMPDIVTMRMLKRRDEDDNFLYTEIIYIDKMGQIKKFISPDKPTPSDTEHVIEWLNDQISQNEDAELSDVADIHTLIEFYNTLTCIDKNSKLEHWGGVGLAVYIERHYYFEIYGIRNNGNNSSETLLISSGNAGRYSILHNYLRKYDSNKDLYTKESIDTYGSDAFNLYLQIDPFMVKVPGGQGYLTGEEG